MSLTLIFVVKNSAALLCRILLVWPGVTREHAGVTQPTVLLLSLVHARPPSTFERATPLMEHDGESVSGQSERLDVNMRANTLLTSRRGL